jgi:hypothetical protein
MDVLERIEYPGEFYGISKKYSQFRLAIHQFPSLGWQI